MKHFNIIVKGKVQGVGFRYSVLNIARTYKVFGFVRNQADGSVYIEAEGEELNLDLFLKWCSRGPGFGRVDKITMTESNLMGFEDFLIM